MLLFRLKKRKKYLFLLELLLLSTAAHGVIGLLLFVAYHGAHSALHVDVTSKKTRRPALFISCKRPSMFISGHHANGSGHGIPGNNHSGARSGMPIARGRRQGSTTSVQEALQQQGASGIIKVPVGSIKKQQEVPGKKHNEKVAAAKGKKAKSVAKKAVKNEIKKEVIKKKESVLKESVAVVKKEEKPVPAPVVKKIKEEPAPAPQPQVARSEQKKQPEPEKIEQPKVQEKVELPFANSVPMGPVADSAHEQAVPEQGQGDVIQDMIVDQFGAQEGYGDYEDFEYAQQEKMREVIMTEIESRWKPPKGLSKDLECELCICVGQGGKVVECTINKPSGVLIYDMAARVAARAMSLPRWAWGKEFTIAFRQ